MQKTFIYNRHNHNISLIAEIQEHPKGLVIVMHGLGSNKEQLLIERFAKAFRDSGFSVVRFDATNSFGESDGKYEDATIENYYTDLCDVITWTQQQSWFHTNFILAGHSLGGMCSLLYAEECPAEIKGIVAIAPVISGKLLVEAKGEKRMEHRKKTGRLEKESMSSPGLIKRLKWSYVENSLKFDVLPKATVLTMPVLIIVGSEDASIPPAHQKLLYEQLPGKKELIVLEGVEHNYREEEVLEEIYTHIQRWVFSEAVLK